MRIKKLLPLLLLPCMLAACDENVVEERGEVPRVLVETDITTDDGDTGEAKLKTYGTVQAFLDDRTALVENTTDSFVGSSNGNYTVDVRAVDDTLEYVFTLTGQGMDLYENQDAMLEDLERSLNELEPDLKRLATALKQAVGDKTRVAAVYEDPEGDEIIRRDYE